MGATQSALTSARQAANPALLSSQGKKLLLAKYQGKVIDGNALAHRIKADLRQHIL